MATFLLVLWNVLDLLKCVTVNDVVCDVVCNSVCNTYRCGV